MAQIYFSYKTVSHALKFETNLDITDFFGASINIFDIYHRKKIAHVIMAVIY